MKNKKLKLNIIPSKETISDKESKQRFVQFFELLCDGHLKEEKESKEHCKPVYSQHIPPKFSDILGITA